MAGGAAAKLYPAGMTDLDVIVVGAGVAGLAAATSLRATGRQVALLEAATRIGGRAHTIDLAGHPFDAGASWLHDADRNALTTLAQADGLALIDSDATRQRFLFDAGRPVPPDGFARASAAFDRACLAAAEHADPAVADAIADLRNDPWIATIENWEACQIAAADPARLSVRDWRDNALEGRNLTIPGGLGAFVARRLAARAGPIHRATPVTAIDWSTTPLRVTTPAGDLRAAAVIVTVSTGVLAAETIRFTPALPPATLAAITALPMGLLSKIALRLAAPDRFPLPPDSSLRRRLTAPGEPAMSFQLRPGGSDLLIGFVGGPTAWRLATQPEAETAHLAYTELAASLGPLTAHPVACTRWGTDPLHRGAYAYARAGAADARATLAHPLADGRLIFAGEATAADGLAGTVGGAWNEGVRAADVIKQEKIK